MINFHIAFDGLDAELGNYFELSKTDLVDFINAECNGHQIHEIPSSQCNQAYIDIRIPQINTTNFIFTVYAHGNDDELISNGAFFIKKDINSSLFINSFFYSMSCLTGKELGKSLITAGSHAFIGYSVEAEALLGTYMQMSIDCDNHGMKNFIRGLRLQECFDGMKQHFTEKIDWLESNGEPLLAAYLLTNRDALVLEGNSDLTLSDFTVD